MSADPAPSAPESYPNLVVLPPAAVEPHGSQNLPPALQALARNPLVLAGGAVLAGVILSRVLGTASARKIARELATEAYKHLKPAATGAATMAGTAAAGSLLEKGIEHFGPQITEFGKKMLADFLRKKE